jgi:hypothetical protein
MLDIFYVRFRALFFGLSPRILCYIVTHHVEKAAESAPFAARGGRITCPRYVGTTCIPITLNLRISRKTACFGPDFSRRYAVDYIGACSQISTNTRFSRVLSPQMCYSSFALNTSVVLCGLW